MAGAYCRFCGRRCFVLRTLPDFSWSGHMATCAGGAAHDSKHLGHTHATALNLVAPVPDGLHLRQVGDTDAWQVVHTASDKTIPHVDWPDDAMPHRYAEIAAASLAASGIAWGASQRDLTDDLARTAAAARAASTTAYDAAVRAGDLADERPQFCQLETRLAAQRPLPQP